MRKREEMKYRTKVNVIIDFQNRRDCILMSNNGRFVIDTIIVVHVA